MLGAATSEAISGIVYVKTNSDPLSVKQGRQVRQKSITVHFHSFKSSSCIYIGCFFFWPDHDEGVRKKNYSLHDTSVSAEWIFMQFHVGKFTTVQILVEIERTEKSQGLRSSKLTGQIPMLIILPQ